VNFDLFCPLLRALMHLPLAMRLPVYTHAEASRERERVSERKRERVCERESEREGDGCMYVCCIYVYVCTVINISEGKVCASAKVYTWGGGYGK